MRAVPMRSTRLSRVVCAFLAALPVQRLSTNTLGVLCVVTATLCAVAPLAFGGVVVGMDAVTAYYPWYAFLGQRLQQGAIPSWNPHQFSGAPFAADPQSGWMYLPVMLLFTALPMDVAAAALLLLHPLIAALSTYALARTLGIGPLGAVLASLSYALCGFLYVNNVSGFTFTSAAVWFPLTLLGAERALRSRGVAAGLWWGVGGLALSQVLAGWLGQGAYYAVLALAAFVLYRTLLPLPRTPRQALHAIHRCVVHLSGTVVFGLALGAAGLLPRFRYFALSNLASGYSGDAAVAYWWTYDQWGAFTQPTELYVGAVTLAIALAAPLIARGRMASPYFAALPIAAFILAGPQPTPLHQLLYLLPGFAQVHPHGPERIFAFFFLGPALLAGTVLTRAEGPSVRQAIIILAAVLGLALLGSAETAMPLFVRVTLASAAFLVVLAALGLIRRRLLGVLLIGLMLVDLVGAGRMVLERYTALDRMDGAQRLAQIDLDSYYRPSGAVQFLQSRANERGELFRYAGYGPRVDGKLVSYPLRWAHTATAALEVNNRATVSGLHDVQGYNPVHLVRYDQFVRALNGRPQNYHHADILESGLTSPLVDLLNVRYLVVPATAPSDSAIQKLKTIHPTVFSGARSIVLENPRALPRAWIVHTARQVSPDQALDLLATGAVDPRAVALLEETPPPLGVSADGAPDLAEIVEYEPDRILVRTHTDADGLLVLSEVYFPAWKAYVDGKPASLYLANHAFRAVPVPAGVHQVELRYESTVMHVGLLISLSGAGLLITLALVARGPIRAWSRAARGLPRDVVSATRKAPAK